MKWVGGKQWLKGHVDISSFLTKGVCYFEPFLGGGSLFFNSQPNEAMLSDSNGYLIDFFIALRDEPDKLIEWLSSWKDCRTREHFIGIRDWDRQPNFESKTELPIKAARFFYIVKRGYNGLYRVNKKGFCNTSWGNRPNATICPTKELKEAHRILKGKKLFCCDYEYACAQVRKDDIIYLDPPYPPKSKTANFTSYTAEGFKPSDHENLLAIAKELAERAIVIVTMNKGPFLKEYRKFLGYKKVGVPRHINSDVKKRGPVEEFILTNRKEIFI